MVSGLIDGTNPHQFVVSLTGVFCNAQDVTVTLTNVQDDHSNILATASATMGLLLGDVDGDGSVTDGRRRSSEGEQRAAGRRHKLSPGCQPGRDNQPLGLPEG